MTESTVTPRDIARRFYESYNIKDLDASWARYISPVLVNHAMGGVYDGDGWREVDKGLLRGFPNLSLKILDQVAEGDKVATRWIVSGTHSGEFMGIVATGRTAVLTATSVDRIQDGKIAEHWLELDFTGFMQQLMAPVKPVAVLFRVGQQGPDRLVGQPFLGLVIGPAAVIHHEPQRVAVTDQLLEGVEVE